MQSAVSGDKKPDTSGTGVPPNGCGAGTANMGRCNGVREIGYFDCDGGGQIVVEGNYAYIGHVNGTTGTTIVDVSDPKKPRHVANVPTNSGIHAHKVRVANGVML